MEKLKKKYEYYKYLNIILLVVCVIWLMVFLAVYGICMEIYQVLLPFLVLEIVVLLMWYPRVYQKERAKKSGTVYQGKITDVVVKDREPKGLYGKRYMYAILVEIERNGAVIKWEDVGYEENPFDYIPHNRSCKVYQYKGKYFLEDFYKGGHVKADEPKSGLEYTMEMLPFLNHKEAMKAAAERVNYHKMKSKTELILLPRFFQLSDAKELQILFVEVRMAAEKEYGNTDFHLVSRIDGYIEQIKNKYTMSDEDKIYEEITELVKLAILKVDNQIEIKEIFVILK